jgi:hypothetical protein
MNEKGAIFKLLSFFLDVMNKAPGNYRNGIIVATPLWDKC